MKFIVLHRSPQLDHLFGVKRKIENNCVLRTSLKKRKTKRKIKWIKQGRWEKRLKDNQKKNSIMRSCLLRGLHFGR